MATASTPTEVVKLVAANELAASIAQAIAAALEVGLSVDEVKAELERAGNLLEE